MKTLIVRPLLLLGLLLSPIAWADSPARAERPDGVAIASGHALAPRPASTSWRRAATPSTPRWRYRPRWRWSSRSVPGWVAVASSCCTTRPPART
ncbi:hypothetical protein VM57_08065 [Stenotrophomonas maltophilia]|uniref:Uncharacterized protein n=1 Tax=Stenotrophomonas maltophilia TaxID=40324 RepID=A0A0F5ZNR4_STEMA|nr:hypothetical protein VM57_08065 [Stenotrophomonas maltophilia]